MAAKNNEITQQHQEKKRKEIEFFCTNVMEIMEDMDTEEYDEYLTEYVFEFINSHRGIEDPETDISFIVDNNELDSEEKRMHILLFAIENGLGLKWTTGVLEKYKLRSLYVRRLFEFVLHFALAQNDLSSGKYKTKELNKLYDKCRKVLKDERKRNTTKSVFGKGKNPTIAQLYEFVSDHMENANTQKAYTKNVTNIMLESLYELESSCVDDKELVVALSKRYSQEFVDACEITRYYFVKYVLFIAFAQAREFKEILLDFSSLSETEVLSKYTDFSICGQNGYWDLKRFFCERLINVFHSYDFKDKDPTDTRKTIMKVLVNSSLFYGESKQRNRVKIWKKDNEEVNKSYSEIMSLTIDDFMQYRICQQKLYNLIFDFWEDNIETARDREFIKELFLGERDLTRDEFMLFLSIANQILTSSDSYNYTEADDSLGLRFLEKDILTPRRFDEIVRRCHYVPVNTFYMDAIFHLQSEIKATDFKKWIASVIDAGAMPYEFVRRRTRQIQKGKIK